MAASRTLDVKLYSRDEIDRNDLQVVQQVSYPTRQVFSGVVLWLTPNFRYFHFTTHRCRETLVVSREVRIVVMRCERPGHPITAEPQSAVI